MKYPAQCLHMVDAQQMAFPSFLLPSVTDLLLPDRPTDSFRCLLSTPELKTMNCFIQRWIRILLISPSASRFICEWCGDKCDDAKVEKRCDMVHEDAFGCIGKCPPKSGLKTVYYYYFLLLDLRVRPWLLLLPYFLLSPWVCFLLPHSHMVTAVAPSIIISGNNTPLSFDLGGISFPTTSLWPDLCYMATLTAKKVVKARWVGARPLWKGEEGLLNKKLIQSVTLLYNIMSQSHL